MVKLMDLISERLNRHIAPSQRNNLICVSWQNVILGSDLLKSLSSVRLLGVVMFRSRVKG